MLLLQAHHASLNDSLERYRARFSLLLADEHRRLENLRRDILRRKDEADEKVHNARARRNDKARERRYIRYNADFSG